MQFYASFSSERVFNNPFMPSWKFSFKRRLLTLFGRILFSFLLTLHASKTLFPPKKLEIINFFFFWVCCLFHFCPCSMYWMLHKSSWNSTENNQTSFLITIASTETKPFWWTTLTLSNMALPAGFGGSVMSHGPKICTFTSKKSFYPNSPYIPLTHTYLHAKK